MDAIGNEGLWRLLEPYDDKSVYAQCSMAFSLGPEHEPIIFVGRTEGMLANPAGRNGFGWDAIFKPYGYLTTFAEMEKAEKNRISHRARALAQFEAYLNEHIDTLLEQQ